MANEEEYQLISRKDISAIKKEIEDIKKEYGAPSSKAGASKTDDPLERLNSSINHLLDVFKEASEQLKIEEHEDKVEKYLAPVEEKLDLILDHTKKIAKGIVALADMIKEAKEAQEPLYRPAASPSQQLPSEPAFVRRTPDVPSPRESFSMQADEPSFGEPTQSVSYRFPSMRQQDTAPQVAPSFGTGPSSPKAMPPPMPPEPGNLFDKLRQ